MRTMRRPALLLLAPATALALTGCTPGAEDTDLGDAPVVGSPATEEPEGADPEGADEATQADGDGAAASGDGEWLEVRDGTWTVGEAGEVEFRVADGALELVDVRPADGWTVTDEEVSTDEIEIDLEQGEVEYHVEIQLEGGTLTIEIDQDIDPAEPGRYEVGVAGEVEWAVSADGGLELVEVVAHEGWTVVEQEADRDDIDVELRNGPATWQYDVDLDSDGSTEVGVDYEIQGPFEG
ncbi:hypothetical protein J4G33_12280 [Actinotalea sp. BY-33]|uniref:Lipoprotein n=1 Tax=Actinotalea soli TaxID=2819234 RepID=A0A939LQI5_9CELL|nr:hypothetical protein [Actinotalea soli]MBO1752581.1 hypothetical protein [Actinotalea soli]